MPAFAGMTTQRIYPHPFGQIVQLANLKIRRHAKLHVHAMAAIVETIIIPLAPVTQAQSRIRSRAKRDTGG